MKYLIIFLIPISMVFSSCCDLFCKVDEDPEDNTGYTCGEDLVDERDNQSYETIKIGDQCWMAENLNYGTFTTSTFTNEGHTDMSNDGTTEKYAYDNEESNNTLYGGLYEWNEVMNYKTAESGQGICPEGWHIPSYDEYLALVETAGGWEKAGKALKIGGSTGFNFLLGGNRREKGNFTGGFTTGSLWTSTVSSSHPDSRAFNIYFIDGADNAAHATDLMTVGKSCRCLKD